MQFLKNRAGRLIDRMAIRASTSLARHRIWNGCDILEAAALKAALDSAEYYLERAPNAQAFDDDLSLLDHAISLANPDGLFLEFGVATGRTIRHIASKIKGSVYGFDSFDGLPEAWWTIQPKGAFAMRAPKVPKNVTLVKGLFSDTLPQFVDDKKEVVSLLHVDCDLYSSTKEIFRCLGDRLCAGSVIVFDEYWNYPSWQKHEHKAFMEFIEASGKPYRYDAFVPKDHQVCVLLG